MVGNEDYWQAKAKLGELDQNADFGTQVYMSKYLMDFISLFTGI